MMAAKPKKAAKKPAAKKPAAKAPKKAATKALAEQAKSAALEITKPIKPARKTSAKAAKPSVPKAPEFSLPKFDPATNWNAAPWMTDPALLARIRAMMAPETIGYPEPLPDVGRAVLSTFEAVDDLASPIAPLTAGQAYCLVTRRDGTFILFRR